MLIVDTNICLAAADRRSEHHGDCGAVLRAHVGELAAPVPVIAEASWLILDRLGATAQNEFLRMVSSGRLETIDVEIPEHLDVHLILDNYGTHKTPLIHRWLLRHPRFHLHFTSTSSSWLNMVERWFAELTNKKIRRGAHRSIRQLERDIRDWIELWNQNPRPYVWVKPAERILASIARYCRAA